VWICPDPRGHLQATGRDARGRKQYRYHADWRQTRDVDKFSRIIAFGERLPRLRRRLARDLALRGLPRDKVLALAVSVLAETLIRVGNHEYARQNNSFGLTTLRNRHVRFPRGAAIFEFRGKSGKVHKTGFRDRRLVRIVKSCQELPGQRLFQYVGEDGQTHAIGSSDVNAYIREAMGQNFSAKDFRTWHGTGHMFSHLKEIGPAESESEAKRNIVAAIKATAAKLGNRPATCRKYYIHPAVFQSYADQTLFSAMNNVRSDSRKPAGKLSAAEVAVLGLVESYTDRGNGKQAKAS